MYVLTLIAVYKNVKLQIKTLFIMKKISHVNVIFNRFLHLSLA